jgi:hypothetical protein
MLHKQWNNDLFANWINEAKYWQQYNSININPGYVNASCHMSDVNECFGWNLKAW